jgi:hypothetical protein
MPTIEEELERSLLYSLLSSDACDESICSKFGQRQRNVLSTIRIMEPH